MLTEPTPAETAMKAAETTPPILREVMNLDKALAETAESLTYLYNRVERLDDRLTSVLGPHRPTEAVRPSDGAPPDRAQSTLASELEARVEQLVRLAAGVRDAARRIDDLTDRVEL